MTAAAPSAGRTDPHREAVGFACRPTSNRGRHTGPDTPNHWTNRKDIPTTEAVSYLEQAPRSPRRLATPALHNP